MSIDRRKLIITGAALVASPPALAQVVYQDGELRAPADQASPPPPMAAPTYRAAETYERAEIVQNASDFFGVTAKTAASAIEKVFRDHGQPTGYIAGEEASAAFGLGVRYGKGLLYMKNQAPQTVY